MAKKESGLSYAAKAGLSYAKKAGVSYAKQALAREAAHAAEALKGQTYDKGYDQYAKQYSPDTEFSAGDDYGFDEHEQYVETPEDDGPDL